MGIRGVQFDKSIEVEGGLYLMEYEIKMDLAYKEQIWNIIKLETEDSEEEIPTDPQDVVKRFEEDKDAQFEKLVQRLKEEGVW